MTNLNIKEVSNALLAMPISKVVGAYRTMSGDLAGTPTKADAIDWLRKQIMDGQISLSQVHNATPQNITSTSQTSVRTPESRALADIGASVTNLEKLVNGRIDNTQDYIRKENAAFDTRLSGVEVGMNNVENKISKVESGLSKLQSGVISVDMEVKALSQKMGKMVIDEAQVSAAVTQVIDSAFAPFRKVVEDAGMQEVVADLTAVRVVERKSALEVFGVEVNDVKGNPLMVDVWNHPAAPAVDPLFIWTRPVLEDLLGVQDTGENLWFGGDRGTGKSETARQFAARTGRNFARVNYHKHSSADEFIGAVGLENGATVFKPGAFLQAFLTPSTVILNDEISNAPEGELATLNPLLEPNCAVIYGGAVRRRAPGVMIFAADNTLGCGDESGRYAGTRTMNSALIDRFARILHFQYLPLAEEVKAVVNHTGCTEALAEHVLAAVRVAREKVGTGDIIDAPSIRSVMAFIRALRVKTVEQAWASCIVSRQPSESRSSLEAIAMTCLDRNLINANI